MKSLLGQEIEVVYQLRKKKNTKHHIDLVYDESKSLVNNKENSFMIFVGNEKEIKDPKRDNFNSSDSPLTLTTVVIGAALDKWSESHYCCYY